MTDFIPEDAMYAVSEMKQVSRNMFRLETTGAAVAGPNRTVTVNLPDNAILDMKSLAFQFKVTCQGAGTPGDADEVFCKMPGHASSMLQQVQVFINGQQIQQSSAEYHTIAAALRLTKSNLSHENTIDRLVSHSFITNSDLDDVESVAVRDWFGFLGEASTRYLNTGLLGSIQLRLVFAGTDCLVPRQRGQNIGVDLSAAAKVNAADISYSVSDMSFSVASVSLDPMYNEMLRERLASGGLMVNYKEYYSFELGNITGASGALRAGLSTQSLDALHGLWRDSNHTETGIKGHALVDATLSSGFVSNQLRFRSYDSGDGLVNGGMSYNYSVNSVRHPQFDGKLLDAALNTFYGADKVGRNDSHQITSRKSYSDGKYVNTLLLNMPTKKGVAVKSGLDSRGINSALVWDVKNVTNPGAIVATGETGILSAFMIAETTATLSIQLGRDLMVTF